MRFAGFEDLIYGLSMSPLPSRSFSEELMDRTMDERLTALAVYLGSGSTPCSVPALSASPAAADPAAGIWLVECREGSYTVMMSGGGTRIIMGGEADDVAEESDSGTDGSQSVVPGPGPASGQPVDEIDFEDLFQEYLSAPDGSDATPGASGAGDEDRLSDEAFTELLEILDNDGLSDEEFTELLEDFLEKHDPVPGSSAVTPGVSGPSPPSGPGPSRTRR